MSGVYTFLPWVRSGVANLVEAAAGSARPALAVHLELEGTGKDGTAPAPLPVERTVELYGPGDVVGVDPAQISRVEPKHWVTNFEPNHLAAIEFYDEDFPWRYTPVAPEGRRLPPWLALVVLEEGAEFTEGGGAAGPLPTVDVTVPFGRVFPDPAETWAWAHVHVNAELSTRVVEPDGDAAARAAQRVFDTAPDTACSRLLCPRKLKPRTGYHAFLVPAFESGRLAGLGRDPGPYFDDPANGLTATSAAWCDYAVAANRPDPARFPLYHRWHFRTGGDGDFESMVRLLRPRPVDSRVGHRDLDVTDPAPNLAGIDDPDLGGVLRLGGALRAPLDALDAAERAEYDRYDGWATPYPHTFQARLAALVNLADDYQRTGPDDPDDPDPIVTPPLYGRWPALTDRLLDDPDGNPVPHRANWVHDLNLDPRWRVAAGYGTAVVRQRQERYLRAAWDQIGDVLAANRRIRTGKLALAAGRHLHRTHLESTAAIDPALVLLRAAPLRARIVTGGLTVAHRLAESPMGPALTSSAMRRTTRPGGRLARRLALTTPAAAGALVARANAGEITAAPPKTAPDGILTPDDLAAAVPPSRRPRLWFVVLLMLVVTGCAWYGILLAALVAAATVLRRRRSRPLALGEDALTPATVDRLPQASGFTLTPDADPRAPIAVPTAGPGGRDNADAVRFKDALRDEYRLIAVSRPLGEPPPAVPLDLYAAAVDLVAGTRPELTVPRWVRSGLAIPDRIREQTADTFDEIMAYPEFDIPMYEPLLALGDGVFVPNLHLLPADSVTLLETDQRFVEAYLVGLNHEFARELLWREYPTDQRGSPFRQFWDVRMQPEAKRERRKDIRPLHEWPPGGNLGGNDNRGTGDELVLAVRGELFKKYPNTVVSAQPARWPTGADGRPDTTGERELGADADRISPLFEARVEPDIVLFGFALTAAQARGDPTAADEPGWFFRIEEVPGDARFGFDVSRDPGTAINVWNDLAWSDVVPDLADGDPVRVAAIPPHILVEPTGDVIEKHEQWEYDRQVPLDAGVSAAELAYIALQTPVVMAVHAAEMLPDQEAAGGR
ncbi:hypothetical protein [Dactylosporangium sp. CS-033363]|uniref:hypothetical protein n=1 Tax=Dactylosporangium sp. CS-033363 TaxID=3239935 RepID=UPI003D8DE103